MKNFLAIGLVAMCLAPLAGAQTPRHDRMDARAAERDIDRLMADRAAARAEHNWGKVKQDNRLMRADWKFVRSDYRKLHRDYYPFR